jgi:predicted metal-dependent hydrolase
MIRKTPRKKQESALKGQVKRWAVKIGVEPKRVQVQRMTRKWASCSTAGRICLSKDLIWENPAFREVVVVHELLHLHVPNHGKLFKSLMAAYLPKWEEVSKGRIRGRCRYQISGEL